MTALMILDITASLAFLTAFVMNVMEQKRVDRIEEALRQLEEMMGRSDEEGGI